jgi:hypothetical protein
MTTIIDPVKLGLSRRAIHKTHSAPLRGMKEGEGDIIGAYGEVAFAELFDLDIDTNLYLEGDGGKDFILSVMVEGEVVDLVVNVHTYRKPYNLLVSTKEIGKPVDIYVLAGFNEDTKEVTFLGWQWTARMEKQPTNDFGYGIINHYMPASELHSMDELLTRSTKINRV